MSRLPRQALHDPVICLAPCLFQSFKRGVRRNPLSLDYAHGGERYRFSAPSQMGCEDLRALQAAVALAGTATDAIDGRSPPRFAGLCRDLRMGGVAKDEPAILVETSWSVLAGCCGYGGGRGGALADVLRASMARLGSVNVASSGGNGEAEYRLLSWDEDGLGRNRLRIALNPRLSLCAKGVSGRSTLGTVRFARIDLTEARRLKGGLARILHQRLCGWVDAPRVGEPARERRVSIATMMAYAWPPAASGDVLRQRRVSLRLALAELCAVGWTVEAIEDGLFRIARPERGRSAEGANDAPSRSTANQPGVSRSASARRAPSAMRRATGVLEPAPPA